MALLASRFVRAILAFLLLLCAGTSEASTIAFRTDAELIVLSDRVVHGRAIRQRTERPEPGGSIYTVTTLAVLEDFTGSAGREIDVWELGGIQGDEIMWVGGQVTYDLGSEVLVCLRRARRGFHSVAMGFSKFDVSASGTLTRNMKDALVLGAPAVAAPERTLGEFRDLTERVRGVRAIRNREAESLVPTGEVSAGFTFLGPYRWTEADSGTPIGWYMSTYAPSPLLSGNGVAELQLALQAWTAPSTASISLQYVGATNVVGDASGLPNGTGVLTFEDPSDEIGGSTLAIGGGFAFASGGGTVNGQTFGKFTRGYVIFQNAADLSSSFRQSTNFARVLEHEIGHTIGLGHSDVSQANVMYPSCCSTSTPIAPALGPDDLAGLNFIYPSGSTPSPPATCTYSISPSVGVNAPDVGGSASVTVTTTSGCAWTATVASGSTSMLSITGGASGSGSGTVSYSVTPNLSGVTRTGAMTIAGFNFIVGQNAVACSYTLSATSASVKAAGGSSSVTVTPNVNGCAWSAASNSGFVAVTSGSSGTAAGTVSYNVASNAAVSYRTGSLTIAGQTFTIIQSGTGPVMSIDKPALHYGAVKTLAGFTSKTPNQTFRLSQSGAGTVTWSAAPSVPWITVSPASGTGPATLTVAVVDHSSVPAIGSVAGAITFTYAGAGTPAKPVAISLNIYPPAFATAPIGFIDTPTGNATGLTGSIAVSGWALDDVAVTQVRIVRDPVAGEGTGLIPIGTAVFVEGSRPDVAAAFPLHPIATRGGWGYLMLTNSLPNGGNGTFRLHAYADDGEGRTALLGSKTITCANSESSRPFGAIDTPAQGEVVSGAAYANFGWVLARAPALASPPNGQVTILVDGVAVGSPGGWATRSDLAGLFPIAMYPGVVSALGVAGLNTTTLSNGLHTIAWVVTADNGSSDGIGSRFFIVNNPAAPMVDASADAAGTPLLTDVDAAPLDRTTLLARRGYDLAAPFRRIQPGADGRMILRGEELDRFEMRLGTGAAKLTGYLRTAAGLTDLPIGSHLDPITGVFTWSPSAGFLHAYDLVFVRWQDGRAISRQEVTVAIGTRGSSRVGPQVTIDVPASGAIVDGPLMLGGWAIDADADSGTGIGLIHVWAYAVDGAPPIFIGVASSGSRPDVAAIYGDQFEQSGFGLIVDNLPPGTYDLAVFPWSDADRTFGAAKLVRVTIR
jgi:hypothetical protein